MPKSNGEGKPATLPERRAGSVDLCDAEGNVYTFQTRHDGGRKVKELLEAGWREATDEDREACLRRAVVNSGHE